MGTYPCSNCGSTADTAAGCPSCGRTLDAEIAELNRTILSMQIRSKSMVEQRSALMGRLQGAIAIRQLLLRAAGRHEGTISGPRMSRIMPMPGKSRPMDVPVKIARGGRRGRATPTTGDPGTGPAGGTAAATAGSTGTAPRARAGGAGAGPTVTAAPKSSGGARRPAGGGGRATGGSPSTATRIATKSVPRQPASRPTATPATHPHHPPETSTRSTQNIVLGLGAIVMAIAVVLTPFFYGSLGGFARAMILGVLTLVTIAAPILLSRFELITTSEWISPLGLLLILLDGQELWTAQISHSGLRATTYAGFVTIVAALVAFAYQRVTGLAVPRFATIALIQPIPALLLYQWMNDLSAWAAVLTLVAAIDVIIALRRLRIRSHGPYLRFAIRTLQEVVNLGALVVGGIALAQAHNTVGSLRAGSTVVAAAVVALAAGLLFGKRPIPDISAGIATVAAIGGFGRMGALSLPGWGLTATAIAITACAIGVYLLPDYARTGAQIGGGAAAIVTALVVVRRGWTTLVTPIRAATPAWHADLDTYANRVAHAGHHTGQLVTTVLLLAIAAAIMLPSAWRRDCLVIGAALATILAPGAWHLPWAVAITIGAVVSLVIGAIALTSANTTQSWIGISSGFVVGGYVTGLSLARPGGQALLLGVLTIGAAAIASSGSIAERLQGRTPDARTIEASWGGAAFALPGAIAATTAIPAPHGAIVAEAVIASAFVAVAATLTAAAITQVAWRRPIPLLVGGAGLGALVTAIVSVTAPELSNADIVVGFALLASGVLLICAPILNTGFRPVGSGRWNFGSLDGDEVAAAAVTCASIVALARVAALVAPAEFLVVLAALVAIIAAGTRSLPSAWRRGPIVGGGIVGALVGATAGYAALDAAITAIRINRPIWNVVLSDWAGRLTDGTIALAHGPQAAIALLLLALAAAIVLPRRASAIAVVIAIGLAALILPATLHTGWWGPVLISGATATGAGIAAAASVDSVVAMTRGGVATLLFANTIAASLVAARTTATTLIGSALVCAVVAATSVRTIAAVRASDRPDRDIAHLNLIGGGALAGAILALSAGTATLTAAADHPLTAVLASALGGLALAVGIITPIADRIEPLLPQASLAVSLGGLAIALTSFANFTTAGVFAASAALLAVLMEVIRSSVARHRDTVEVDGVPVRRPVRVGIIIGWFPQRTEVLLAAGPATTLAVASIAPTLFAALVGPYHWIGMIWHGAPHTTHDELGALSSVVGAPVGLVTAVLLTVMATIGVIGFGGSREAVTARAVAVITPGIAICLLIAPYLVRAAWPAGPLAALAVATISGLALALTEQPPDADSASALRFARKFVVGICVLATGAGIAGSLATRPMTIIALAIAAATGVTAALAGRELISRVTGWIVTASAGQLLALVASLSAGMKPYNAAFIVGAVAAALLIVAAELPRLRLPESLTETLTVEVSAYAGAVLALVLAAHSIAHLAVFLGAWGAVLGIATARQRSAVYRSILMWTAAAHELAAWFLLMTFARVGVPEAYTLGIAVIALVTGWIELRWHPELTSWVTYGIALSAALGPSLVIVIATGQNTLRLALLLIGSTAVLIGGAVRRQQAPTIIGGVALLGATINLVARYSATILVLVLLTIIAGVLIGVGANFEKQRRNLSKAWTVLNKMQ